MTSDQIFLLTCALREDSTLRAKLNTSLRELTDLPEYVEWQSTALQSRPFYLPFAFDSQTLTDVGLATSGILAVRVNLHLGQVFITDGVWTDGRFRAFPFHDESVTLVQFAQKLGWASHSDVVLDLAGGCGHSAWSFKAAHQVLLDINPRALAYAEVNRLLNELPADQYGEHLNDIRTGIPSALAAGSQKGVLVVANMPFGPAPSKTALPLTTNGGNNGLALQEATLAALQKLRAEMPTGVPLRALVMGLSPGNQAANSWELPRLANQFFDADFFAWEILADEALFRLNGARAMPNPCPAIQALPAAADCRLYTPDLRMRDTRREEFVSLATSLADAGTPDLAYGVVALEVL